MKDYEEFSTVPEEQNGNYLAVKLPDTETCEITTASGTQSVPPEDRDLVWRVSGQDATLKVKTEEREEIYSASGLTLEKDPAMAAMLHAVAPLTAEPYTNSPAGEGVSEGKLEPLSEKRISVVGVGSVVLPEGVDLVGGHLDAASLLNLTQKDLLALAEEMGLSPSKRATKSELAALLSSVELETVE